MAVTTPGNPIINDVRHWRHRAQEARALPSVCEGQMHNRPCSRSPLNTNGLPRSPVSVQSRQVWTKEAQCYQSFIQALSSISR
jgi:hypothetical protein